jgi:hypothetical protein
MFGSPARRRDRPKKSNECGYRRTAKARMTV